MRAAARRRATTTVRNHPGTERSGGGGGTGGGQTAIALELAAHPDPDALGGYNLQIIAEGFEFDQQGYGQVSIDGAAAGRAYTDWLQLPKMEPGDHTVAVALNNGLGQPLEHYGEPVAAAITVGGAADGMEMAMAESAVATSTGRQRPGKGRSWNWAFWWWRRGREVFRTARSSEWETGDGLVAGGGD